MPPSCHPSFGAAEVKGAEASCSKWLLRHHPDEEETYVTHSMDGPGWYDPERHRESSCDLEGIGSALTMLSAMWRTSALSQ